MRDANARPPSSDVPAVVPELEPGSSAMAGVRSRLLRFGAGALGDTELLALLLRGPDAQARARSLMDAAGGLGGLGGMARTGGTELVRGARLGQASAAAVVASIELSRRIARERHPWSLPLRRPTDVAEYVRAELRGAAREHFMAIGLDARQRVLLVRTVAIGSLAQVDVHPRELFRPMVRAGVHSMILVHNHPSGDPRPSDADVELTHRMAEVGRLLGVPVLDHLVVTDEESVSLASLGLVPK